MKYFKLIRVHQWLKNSFIFLPLFFGKHLLDIPYLLNTTIAFIAFSFAASSIYCFNDIWDREADKVHPMKKSRPIASGEIGIWQGYLIMIGLFVLSLIILFLWGGVYKGKVIQVILFYYMLNLLYCVKLKQIPIIDVFIIATGFVLRVVAGGFSTGIRLSQWIILMTFLLALFLAFAKRRDDLVIRLETGAEIRKNISRYNLDFLNQVIAIISSVTIVCYIMYTVSEDVTTRIQSNYVYVTAIWVLAGIVRYLQLTTVDLKSGSPTKILIKDRFIHVCITCWIINFILLIYC